MTHRRRPLRVDPVEDRVVPSYTPTFGFTEEIRLWASYRDHPVGYARPESFDPSRGGDRGPVESDASIDVTVMRSRTIVVIYFSDRTDDAKPVSPQPKYADPPDSVATPLPAESRTPAKSFPTRATESSFSGQGSATAAVMPSNLVASTGSGIPAVHLSVSTGGPVFVTPETPAAARPTLSPAVPDRVPPDGRTDPAVVRAIVLSGVEAPLVPSTPGEPTAGDPSPVLPAPRPRPADSVIDRIVEAVFPDGVPFIGAVPVDDLSVGATAVIDRLAGLGDPSPDAWASPERWAWATAAVLTAGGVAASARPRRDRRPAVPGPGPDLGRWEDPIDYGST